MNDTKWVSMWGNAMSIAEHHPEGYAKDLTLRYPVYAPFSGSALRFTLDNYCGKEPVTIHRATVAVCVPTSPGSSAFLPAYGRHHPGYYL